MVKGARTWSCRETRDPSFGRGVSASLKGSFDMKYILAAVVLSATISNAQACSCGKAEPVEKAVRQASLMADTVVLAEAQTIDEVYTIKDRRVSRAEFEASFLSPASTGADYNVRQVVQWRVLRAWKGSTRAGMTVETDTRVLCCTCGVAVSVGRRLVLYLNNEAVNSLSMCSVGSDYSVDKQSRILGRLFPKR